MKRFFWSQKTIINNNHEKKKTDQPDFKKKNAEKMYKHAIDWDIISIKNISPRTGL